MHIPKLISATVIHLEMKQLITKYLVECYEFKMDPQCFIPQVVSLWSFNSFTVQPIKFWVESNKVIDAWLVSSETIILSMYLYNLRSYKGNIIMSIYYCYKLQIGNQLTMDNK